MKKFLLLFWFLFGILLLPYEGRLGRGLYAFSWGVQYGAGSPFMATDWRHVENTEFYEKFTQMWQVHLSHQIRGDEFGAATAGYRYPSIGVYLQWMDYGHLSMRGLGDLHDQTYSYGQIASMGWTLHQTCWNSGKWSGHIQLEHGAAYVFDPVYTIDPSSGNAIATLAQPWQFMIGLGWHFAREIKGGEITFGPHFTHMSNSGLAAYNTGINNFSLSLGYSHRSPKEERRCPPEKALKERDGTLFRRHLYTSVVAGLGGVYFEHSAHSNGQLTVMGDVMYRLAPTHGVGIGVDYFHCSQPDRCGRTDYIGTAFKYDHWWGGFVFHAQCGAYLNARRPIKWKGMSRIYQNIGYKYVFFRHRPVAPYLGIYTKGNGFNAEQMAFSLGAIIR